MLPDNAAKEAKENRRKNQLSREKVDQTTRDDLAVAIANVDDPDAREALSLMMEVICGDTPSERPVNGGRGETGGSPP